MSDHSRVDDFFQVSIKTVVGGIQIGGLDMGKEEYVDWLNSVDKEDRTDLMELEITDDMEYAFF